MKKFNRTTTIINSIYEANFPIDDDTWLKIELYGLQGNEFRKIIPTFELKNLCKVLKNNTFYKGVSEVSNFPSPSKDLCPIPVEHYTIENYRFEVPESNFMLSYSFRQTKVIVNYYKDETCIAIVAFYIINE